ncbi:MAG: hypothetical protein M0P31_15535 [Solirubrobacteraceae bacterium]|nr:hypothetical protein [Solirubrobacteraceae bacterium]
MLTGTRSPRGRARDLGTPAIAVAIAVLGAMIGAPATAATAAAKGDGGDRSPISVPLPDEAEPLSVAELWAFADRRQADVEPYWSATLGRYMPVDGTEDVRLAANMLQVHASAALGGHVGATRRDDRVHALVDLLTRAPAFIAPPTEAPRGTHGHVPGWTSSSLRPGWQHVAVDAQVVDALTAAWDARDVVGLPAGLRDRIAGAISSVADSPFYRYPAQFLTQWNWHADLDAAAFHVTGDRRFLDDYRRQLSRFVRGSRIALDPARTPFLNPGLGLLYAQRKASAIGAPLLSTSEYENLVFSGLRHYDMAVRAGMRPLSGPQEQRLREWSQRVMFGDWTHAGALNWDTSLGTRRWWLARYWAFAQQGLETFITARRLSAAPDQSAWAAAVADAGLRTYERWASAYPDGRLPSQLWGVEGRDRSEGNDPVFTATRVQAHASRLALLRPGNAAPERPPAWFARDNGVGRLVVSTPAYSTGVLVRHPTDDYGGIEMARLLNADGMPVSGIGGSGRSAFGLDLVRRGRVVLDTQPGRSTVRRGRTSVRVDAGPRRSDVRDTFTGALRVRSRVANAAGSVELHQRFHRGFVVVRRTVEAERAGTATTRFPSWGDGARLTVVRRSGRTERLTGRSVSAAGAVGLVVESASGGYAVDLCEVPRGSRLRAVTVPSVATSPRTRRVALLSVRVAADGERRTTVRITPTTGEPPRPNGAPGACS